MRSRIGSVLTSSLALALFFSLTLAQTEPHYDELPNFHRVNSQLYRGGQPEPGGFDKLSRLGIKTIINLRDDDSRAIDEAKQARTAGFTYFNVPVARLGRPNEADIRKVLAIIAAPENQPVFVHCKYGADRTGVVIGSYRILHDGWTSERAKAEAKSFGMKLWEVGMKDYLRDLYRQQQVKTPATTSSQ